MEWPAIEPRHVWWEAGDQYPEPWHSYILIGFLSFYDVNIWFILHDYLEDQHTGYKWYFENMMMFMGFLKQTGNFLRSEKCCYF